VGFVTVGVLTLCSPCKGVSRALGPSEADAGASSCLPAYSCLRESVASM
jgi:hypothetical protein